MLKDTKLVEYNEVKDNSFKCNVEYNMVQLWRKGSQEEQVVPAM